MKRKSKKEQGENKGTKITQREKSTDRLDPTLKTQKKTHPFLISNLTFGFMFLLNLFLTRSRDFPALHFSCSLIFTNLLKHIEKKKKKKKTDKPRPNA